MQCSVYIATSLDGFIAGADGRIDWLGIVERADSIIPILLGEGARLFGKIGGDIPLRLVSSRAFESGLVQLRYELA